MTRILDSDDMVFHMLVAGGTGSGKTNALLHMLDLLFNKKVEGRVPPSLFLFDPAGDASIDLLRAIPESERSRVVILDPQYVTFGFNLLSLPENLDPADRPEILQAQVDEFSALLADVFNTDATNAPRLMWIFKGALYYLYSFPEDPTLWELYNIMLRFTKRNTREIEYLLRSRNVNDEIIQGTIEAISKLPPDAYAPVLNRISNFVLPSTSITFRTFCSRKSTVDLEKLMEPGRLTIFRIPSSLPGDFRKLFAASVVMKLYFASLKRAKRLERSGQPPTARSPVVLAADEFRDIAQMKILRTILSQSRKYGLYLWMVVQTLSEVPDELMGSIEANVGPVLAFRGSPDDARRLAKLLHPQRAETVEKLIPGLEDYAAIVRKRPVGGKPVEPPFRVTFPKLREPACGYAEALDYIKKDMQKKYGGAVGDKNLLFIVDEEKARKDRGECYLGIPLYWIPLPYLHFLGVEMGFKVLSRIFEDRYGWQGMDLQIGLNRLVESGRVAERPGAGGQLFVDLDPATKLPRYKEPETDDERDEARDVLYSITPAANDELFKLNLKSSHRPGGSLHALIMKKLLDDYWRKGNWCAWDRGDRSDQFPDILVTPPVVVHVRARDGRPATYYSEKDWDEANRMPVEIEINPSKNLQQLRENYKKNVPKYPKVRFVVPSGNQETEVRSILQDKDRATFEVVVEGAGLPKDDLEKMIDAEPQAGVEGAPASATGGGGNTAALQRNEVWILTKICESGWGGRAEFASGLSVTERQVTRYLDALEARKLVQKKGKGYLATDAGRNLVAQAGWKSANLQTKLD